MSTATKQRTETEKLFADLDKPSLHGLSYALRHPDTWPKGFVWNYSKCDQCAMGLAHALWKQIPSTDRDNGASIMAHEFGMPYATAQSIFLAQGETNGWCPFHTVVSGRLWWKE